MTKNPTDYKQTEIGEVPEDWVVSKLTEFTSINPQRTLKKQQVAKSVPMANIQPFDKKILNYELKPYNGGIKFINSDTLLARITPCLENGKTAFVDILDNSEVGFGSTEFIVLNGIKNKTSSQFVYYLACSPRFRAIAIKSMVGSSGRQRVQTEKLASSLFAFPSLAEQQQIASVLSSIDEKIQLNRRMNRILEEMGKALFKRWFVEFEFPNENNKPYKSSGGEMVDSEMGMIPRGWKVEPVGIYIDNFDSQRVPLSSREREKRQGIYRYFGATGVMDYIDNYLFDGIYLLIGEDGTVTKEGGFPYTQYVWGKFWVNNHAHIIKAKPPYSTEFIKLFFDSTIITAYITGAVQPKLNQSNLNSIPFIVPNEKPIGGFEDTINKLYSLFRTNEDEINNLMQVRDSLLPRLMNGKLRVN